MYDRYTMPQLEIPDFWSDNEALAIYEFLSELQQRIWAQYELQIIDALRDDLDENNEQQLDLFDLNDSQLF